MKNTESKNNVNLTPSQIEAIKTVDKPVLVIAVAGSGKTRVITEKIKYLISLGYPANSIVAITFTNKAANEMKKRVGEFTFQTLPYVTTIHSFCLRLLKQYPDLFNINKDFLVADEELQLSIIKDILKKKYNLTNYSTKSIRHEISLIKINLDNDISGLIKIFSDQKKALDFYNTYQKYLLENNLLDFGDLILKVVETLKSNESIKLFFQNRFSYFLIDEYQDTNQIQRKLLKLLVKVNNITAVGDEDQSIYSFRGSDITNIMNFENDFENAKIIFMEKNFRSNVKILDIANIIIKQNQFRRNKKLIPDKTDNGEVHFFREYDEKREAKRVVNIIKNNINDGYNYNDIAILYRANWQSAYIEQYLFKNHIPYKIYHGLSFYKRKEIKTIFNFIGFILNSNSIFLLKSVINIPKKGIGEKTIDKIIDKYQSSKNNILLDILKESRKNTIKEFAKKIIKLKKIKKPSILIESIINEFKLYEYFEKEDSTKLEDRKENISQLIKISKEFEIENGKLNNNNNSNINNHLNENNLLDNKKENNTDNKNFDPLLEFYNQFMLYSNENPLNTNGVNLLTLHSAKGLEFKIVIIIGVINGIIPMIKMEDVNEISNIKKIMKKRIEEERRLFYVGITRAKEKVYFISYYYSSNFYRSKNSHKNVSSFLTHIPKEYFDTISIASENPNYFDYKNTFKNNSFNSTLDELKKLGEDSKEDNEKSKDIINNFEIGDKVLIQNYGKGAILEIAKLKNMTKLTIKMENGNNMTFIKEYAKIKKLNEK